MDNLWFYRWLFGAKAVDVINSAFFNKRRKFVMKTFITEQQLALYKYQPQSRYYNWLMADIAISEYQTIIDKVE